MDECWTCGHFLIGGGCFKNGSDDIQTVAVDYSCNDWRPEDTPGTITHEISEHVKNNFDEMSEMGINRK